MFDGRLNALLADAQSAGRELLLENEGLALLEAAGFAVPVHAFVTDRLELAELDLASLPGERLVLKAVVPGLAHKTEQSGVVVVPKEPEAVGEVAAALEERFGGDLHGLLLCEFVEHGAGVGGELLLNARWTDDFGPVVTLGPGGVQAEALAQGLDGGAAAAIVSSTLDPGARRAALAGKRVVTLVCEPQRGQAPIASLDGLFAVVDKLLALAERTMPAELREIEINPLVFRDGQAVALDALVRTGGGVPALRAERPLDRLSNLLAPRSLAIQGVSAKTNPGRIVLDNVLASGFDRERITLIKPGHDELAGCRCVPDAAALPEAVDLAVLAVSAQDLPAALGEFIDQRKTESLVLIAGGVGESPGSEETLHELERRIEAARDTDWGGPVVNGANCLGVRSVPGGYDTMFIPRHKLRYPEVAAAPLALISQSGALAVARASGLAEINPRFVVSIGNQLDLTVGDYLSYLADDPEVRVFACYVEGFQPGDGRRWLGAARRVVESGRAVVLYRAGRTAAGGQAAASHTASIAGDYAVTRELARAAGVLVADTLGEFHDLIRLAVALDGREVTGRRLGALSNAGFECVAIADGAGELSLVEFGAETVGGLDGLLDRHGLGSVVRARNPLDVTPIVGDEAFCGAVERVLGDSGVDVGLVGCVPLTGALSTLEGGSGHGEDVGSESSVVGRLVRLWGETEKAWAVVVDGGADYDAMARLLAEGGVPVFRSVDRALRLLSLYVGWRCLGD